jgi:hypothetical protein
MRLYVRLCASVQVKDSGSLGYMYAAEIHAFAFEHLLLYWFTPPKENVLADLRSLVAFMVISV